MELLFPAFSKEEICQEINHVSKTIQTHAKSIKTLGSSRTSTVKKIQIASKFEIYAEKLHTLMRMKYNVSNSISHNFHENSDETIEVPTQTDLKLLCAFIMMHTQSQVNTIKKNELSKHLKLISKNSLQV